MNTAPKEDNLRRVGGGGAEKFILGRGHTYIFVVKIDSELPTPPAAITDGMFTILTFLSFFISLIPPLGVNDAIKPESDGCILISDSSDCSLLNDSSSCSLIKDSGGCSFTVFVAVAVAA